MWSWIFFPTESHFDSLQMVATGTRPLSSPVGQNDPVFLVRHLVNPVQGHGSFDPTDRSHFDSLQMVATGTHRLSSKVSQYDPSLV